MTGPKSAAWPAGAAVWFWPTGTRLPLSRVERRVRRRRLLQLLREQRRGQQRDLWAGWQLLGVTTDV